MPFVIARLRRLVFVAAVVAPLSGSAAVLAADDEPAPPTRPALERCREFCSSVYGPGSAERAQCAEACGDADVCATKCASRFPDDKGKQAACLKQCMRARPVSGGCRRASEPTGL